MALVYIKLTQMQEYHKNTRRAEEALKCTQNDLNGWIVIRKMCSWINQVLSEIRKDSDKNN